MESDTGYTKRRSNVSPRRNVLMITETGTISAHAARRGVEQIESSVIRPLCIRGLVAMLLFLKLQLQSLLLLKL